MTFTESAIGCIAAVIGAYEAFLSMFVQRPSVLVWILSPPVWPVSWILDGPLGRFRLAYLILSVVVIAVNAAIYAIVGWAGVHFLRKRLHNWLSRRSVA